MLEVYIRGMMIFITVGTQKFQFNRLLKIIDKAIETNIIADNNVFAQSGACTYLPKHYITKDYLNHDEFDYNMSKADIVVTHGGTGTIINALKKEKKVLAIARQSKYGEHVDNHQIQLLQVFEDAGLIATFTDEESFQKVYLESFVRKFKKFQSTNQLFIHDIEKYLDNVLEGK